MKEKIDNTIHVVCDKLVVNSRGLQRFSEDAEIDGLLLDLNTVDFLQFTVKGKEFKFKKVGDFKGRGGRGDVYPKIEFTGGNLIRE